MPSTEPYAQIDLDTLLEHLRLRGITVGTVELQNLQRVFSRSPQLSHPGLQDLLCSILAKDVTQRQTIIRLYNQLIPFDADEQGDETTAALTPKRRRSSQEKEGNASLEADEPEQVQPKEPLNIWRLGLRALLLATFIMLGVAGWMSLPHGDEGEQVTTSEVEKEPRPLLPEPDDKPEEKPGDLKLVKHIDLWYPSIEVEKISPWPRLLPPLLLFLGAGLGFIWLLQQALQKTRLRTPKPPQLRKERGRFYVPVSAKQADYHLLSGDERREMSWGIHHYLTDVPLDKLDIELSVKRSAQTGLPQIEFERASREREVWLWQEQGSNNPNLIRHIDEIVQTLRPANITVQRGYFRGLPDRVRDSRGEVLWSSRHEYPEHHPLVVIFADATRLASSMQQNPDHAAITLRLLGEWSHLCFVDHEGGLQSVLNAQGLTCLLPNEVSGWLAQQGGMRLVPAQACKLDDVYDWAVACSLPDRVLIESEVRALHQHLDLKCAWQFSALRQYAEEFGQGLDFSAARVGMLNAFGHWLRSDEENAGKALDFWIQRSDEIDRTLKARELEGKDAWDKTRKQQQLMLDRALLQLWREPAEAAIALHDLHSEKKHLRRMVVRKLRQFTCSGFPVVDTHVEERITLPWVWGELSVETQQQLLLCGFSGVDGKASRLQLDWLSGAVLSGLAGFALAGLLGSVTALLPQDAVVETQLNSAQPPSSAVLRRETDEQLVLGTYKAGGLVTAEKEDNHRLVVSWKRSGGRLAQQPVTEDEETAVWVLGEEVRQARPAGWPGLSLAVIAADPDKGDTRRLAAFLLDSGNVDRVLMGEDWRKVYLDWMRNFAGLDDVQWLFIGEKPRYLPAQRQDYMYLTLSPADLLKRLQRDNEQHVSPKWAQEVRGNPVLLAQKKEKPTDTLELAHGMKLVKIPRGQFEMGSEKGGNDERPVHTVTIDYEFWMSQTEVTFEQYDAYVEAINSKAVPVPDDSGWGRGKRPVVNVSWEDAQGYVKWLSETNNEGLQCRLPSEAEWEYAARAGSKTTYSWGDAIEVNRANCVGCGSQWDNKLTAPVGSFSANDFKLYDMHGNVNEWVQDCYAGSYADTPVDGSAQKSAKCGSRVLRGGAWIFTVPFDLRSSNRSLYSHDFRSFNTGVRIVCPVIPTIEEAVCTPIYQDGSIMLECSPEILSDKVMQKLESRLHEELAHNIDSKCSPELEGDSKNTSILVHCGYSHEYMQEMLSSMLVSYNELNQTLANLKTTNSASKKLLGQAKQAVGDGEFELAQALIDQLIIAEDSAGQKILEEIKVLRELLKKAQENNKDAAKL